MILSVTPVNTVYLKNNNVKNMLEKSGDLIGRYIKKQRCYFTLFLQRFPTVPI